MKRMLLLSALLLAAPAARAANGGLPVAVTHSGYVLAANDEPLTSAAASMQFQLFAQAAPAGGEVAAWDATCSVEVRAGYYAVVLGQAPCAGASPLDTAALPADSARWLQVSIDGTPLLPRIAVTSSPAAVSALHALDADKLGGVAASALLDESGRLLASALPAGGIVDAHVAAGAAISAAKITGLGTLAARNVIANADVDANAAIAASKIAGLGPFATKTTLSALDVTTGLGFAPFNPATSLTLPTDGLSVGSTQLVLTGGRVGIGTASPAAIFDVGGTEAMKVPVGTTAERPGTPAVGMIRFNTTTASLEVYAPTGWERVGRAFGATGGTITDASGWRTHTFTTSGTFNVTVGAATVEVLVVGGGGGGGCDRGGGGGGGGVVFNSAYAVTAGQAITVTVGNGGNGSSSDLSRGANGQPSVFGTITANGGGGGGSETAPTGNAGGSGGGGSYNGAGGAGTSLQGFAGGNGVSSPRSPGGGGGAGAAGQNGNTSNPGPAGGSGVQYFGAFYGGGGGAGDNRDGMGSSGPGAGGNGGGGAGGLYVNNSTKNGTAGTPNTGGGGGGGGYADTGAGGNGGSGIVIVRYPY